MMANEYRINPISAEVAGAIKRKSAFNLPDRPSERGMKPDEIKRALYGPITDSEDSVLEEIGRVITEANKAFSDVEAAVDKKIEDSIYAALNTPVEVSDE